MIAQLTAKRIENLTSVDYAIVRQRSYAFKESTLFISLVAVVSC